MSANYRYILIVQVLRYWPFGALWCRIWLAVDVWLCTASIFNLCAISIDRYIAISRPVKYPAIMSPRRARLLIISVWILSFIICFPPLIGWNERGGLDFGDDVTHHNWTRLPVNDVIRADEVVQLVDESAQQDTRYELVDSAYWVTSEQPGLTTLQQQQQSYVMMVQDQCQLTSVPGYIVYSACGSFWVPMLGMIVFYWKIYKTAVAATEAVNRGFVEPKISGLLASAAGAGGSGSSENTSCKLRVHRGGAVASGTSTQRHGTAAVRQSTASGVKLRHSAGCISELLPRPSAECLHRASGRRSVDGRLQTTPASSAATPRTATSTATTDTSSNSVIAPAQLHAKVTSHPVPTIVITSSTHCHDDAQHAASKNTNTSDVTSSRDVAKAAAADVIQQQNVKPAKPSTAAAAAAMVASRAVRNAGRVVVSSDDVSARPTISLLALHQTSASAPCSTRTSASSVTSAAEKRTSLIASRFAKLHIISQLRNLNKEKKAAKTVGIIVGCFMVCWAPFFTVYLAEAFCRHCTPAVLFNVFFWLGYCNSAANPFIYGLCSKDFRYAFQKFLRCRYTRTKPALRHSANSQMMTMLQSLTMQVVAGGTVNAAANVSAAAGARAKANRRKRN